MRNILITLLSTAYRYITHERKPKSTVRENALSRQMHGRLRRTDEQICSFVLNQQTKKQSTLY